MKNLQKHEGSIRVVFSAILVVILILSGSAPVFAEQKAAQVPEPAPDLSNVYIPAMAQNYPESFREQLARDHFLVMRNTASWLGSYEYFTYMQTPIFISTDSVLHFQHILFSKLLQSTEENVLVWRLEALSKQMFEESKAQLELLQGTPWEAAARTNLDFFQVGVLLLADGQEADIAAQGLSDNAAAELESIIAEDGIRISAIFSPEGEEPQMEDYSQYKTRGYYTKSPLLARYFKAMMWFGRRHFSLESEHFRRAAVLQSLNFAQNEEIANAWQEIYDISALFAGESDDILFLHLVKLMRESYGEKLSLENLLKDEAAWENFSSACRDLPKAKLDSRVREEEDSSNEELGFRFMGQRYALDQEIFSKLIWSKVKENREGVQRSLPKVLDVAAVFGSPVADKLLEEAGDFEFKNFTENLQDLKDKFGKSTGNADNFAAAWLDLLRPLLADKSETSDYYPSFMRGDKWAKRNLECFAGSYTELKHDTILYSKQVMAEMGGMFRDKIDDRGYVQPEPEVYRALAKLNRRTLDTLENAAVIDEKSFEPINLYIDLCERLAEISEIELAGELPSDDDFEFIRAFGGNISHIDFLLTNWEEVGALGAEKLPDEIVADIASNPESNQCLEVAIGKPQNIWVIVPVDGSLRLAVGLVYDFYEFPVSFEQRMTDEDWTSIYMQKVLGHEPFGNETVEVDLSIEPLKPSWTEEYRYDPEKEGEQAPQLNTLPNWVALFSAERMSSDGSFVASLNQGKLKLEDKEGMQISIPSYISFVQDAHFLDLDQDGSEELMLLCWKYGRFGNLRPFG